MQTRKEMNANIKMKLKKMWEYITNWIIHYHEHQTFIRSIVYLLNQTNDNKFLSIRLRVIYEYGIPDFEMLKRPYIIKYLKRLNNDNTKLPKLGVQTSGFDEEHRLNLNINSLSKGLIILSIGYLISGIVLLYETLNRNFKCFSYKNVSNAKIK